MGRAVQSPELSSVVWSPQPGPQKALIDCPVPEILFGGARAGGKTSGVLGKYGIKAADKHFNAIFFRRELPSLDDAIEESKSIYPQLGARWNEQRKLWRFPNGARIRFRPLETLADCDKYQGQNISSCCIEEAGTYPDSRVIDRMQGALRSAYGLPTQLILTANPGGVGQQWIKERYIDACPQGMKVCERNVGRGRKRKFVYIPSKITDNKILLRNDPSYIDRLHLVGSDALVKAWLEGDWNAVQGAFFDCWNENHIINPIPIPAYWLRFRSFDWGSASPFSVGWWAVSDGSEVDGRVYPKNSLIRYREWYGAKGPNIGLKLTNNQISDGIRSRENEKITYGVADPSIFISQGGPSIAEQMAKEGIIWRKADNRRVGKQGAMSGWAEMRSRLIGIDGRPMIYTFSNCLDSIRTIPTLPHDDVRLEDVDTRSEDHAADEWRYACMSRPWTMNRKPTPESIIKQPTFDEMLKYTEKIRGLN